LFIRRSPTVLLTSILINTMKLSVVIPAFNESENIEATIVEVAEIVKSSPEIADYQIIIVDDHSSDNISEIIENLKVANLEYIRLSRQSGSHIAARAGLALADGDVILVMAADGQDNPNILPEMVRMHQQGFHTIWALREDRKNESWLTKLPAFLFYKILNFFSEAPQNIDLSRADFYMVDKMVKDSVMACTETETSLYGLISWVGFNQGTVVYPRRDRRSGSSKWSFKSRLKLAKDWIVAFSGVPLKLISWAGALVAFLGVIYAFYIFINYLLGAPVAGWSSIMITLLILGGGQMAMLGVIGEYLWKNMNETRRRPLYFVEKQINKKP